MARRYRWKDPQGVATVKKIVKKLVPQWKDGLYPTQLNLVVRILDGEDIFCALATGGGKSALFAVPILVLKEMALHPEIYPALPVRALPVGIVIAPTKGLAANIVFELGKLNIPALSYCQETVTQARKDGRNLVHEIRECKTWNIICVDPEHLRDKSWRQITAYEIFSANVVYSCVDEAHLINQWGASFRPQFKHIGSFFRGRLPSSASIMALTATAQPGSHTNSICASLGFSGDDFHLYRASNERPNIQLILEPLTHAVGGKTFPQLLDYLNSGRKSVVHCRTMDDVLHIFLYLWKSLPDGPHRLRRLKMYHALRSLDDNKEILRLIDEDPECQVIISTIAFAQGMNSSELLDSYAFPMPDEVDQMLQQLGRAGRKKDVSARGVVFVQSSTLSAAEKQLAGPSEPAPPTNTTKSKRKKKTKPLEHAEVLLLTEKHCYNAALNRIYQNPPVKTSTLDCIAANRPLPCSLCAARNKIELDFPAPTLPPGVKLPLFTLPPASGPTLDKKLRLTKKERQTSEPSFITFGQTIYRAEHRQLINHNRPKSSYLPSSLVTAILDNLLALDSLQKLEPLLQSWAFSRGYCVRLYAIVQELRTSISTQREDARAEKNAKQRASRRSKAKKPVDSESEEDEPTESDSSGSDEEHPRSSPIPPPSKRTRRILEEVTNQARPTRARAKWQPQQRLVAVAETFSAPYKTSRRRAAQL
ncbi:P-loop containing nucleoside triphosphate hydrolase protein [Mycena galopus ATCC 62051]|nr:P-loop containing nucleoside triphosphate hydrolase protein [Mycena galopus ATCC 62051]